MSLSEQELAGLHARSFTGSTGRFLQDTFVPFSAVPSAFRVHDTDPLVFSGTPVIVAHTNNWPQDLSIFDAETRNSMFVVHSMNDVSYGTLNLEIGGEPVARQALRFRAQDPIRDDLELWSFLYRIDQDLPSGNLTGIDYNSFQPQPAPASLSWTSFFREMPEDFLNPRIDLAFTVERAGGGAINVVGLELSRADGDTETARVFLGSETFRGRAPTARERADEVVRIDADRDYLAARDGTPTAADALEVLRLAVGLEPSFGAATPEVFIAADINRSGQVTADDALALLRLASGLESDVQPQWVFVDASADLGATVTGRDAVHYETGVILAQGQDTVMLKGILLGSFDGF